MESHQTQQIKSSENKKYFDNRSSVCLSIKLSKSSGSNNTSEVDRISLNEEQGFV